MSLMSLNKSFFNKNTKSLQLKLISLSATVENEFLFRVKGTMEKGTKPSFFPYLTVHLYASTLSITLPTCTFFCTTFLSSTFFTYESSSGTLWTSCPCL